MPVSYSAGTVLNTVLMTSLNQFLTRNVGNKIHNPHPDFVPDQTNYDLIEPNTNTTSCTYARLSPSSQTTMSFVQICTKNGLWNTCCQICINKWLNIYWVKNKIKHVNVSIHE